MQENQGKILYDFVTKNLHSPLPHPTLPTPPPSISYFLDLTLSGNKTSSYCHSYYFFFFFFWITPASWQLCKIMAPGCERAESETMKEPFIPCLKLFVQMLPLKMDYPPPQELWMAGPFSHSEIKMKYSHSYRTEIVLSMP